MEHTMAAGTTRKPQYRSAFTLLEMLISVSILALVITVITAALYSGIVVWEQAGGYGAGRMDAIVAIERLESDLGNSVPFFENNFSGNADSMSFTRLVHDDPGYQAVGRICLLQYEYDAKTKELKRRIADFSAGDAGDAGFETILSGVERMKLTYAEAPKTRTEAPLWGNSWTPGHGLPIAVGIEIEIIDGGRRSVMARTLLMAVRVEQIEKEGMNVSEQPTQKI